MAEFDPLIGPPAQELGSIPAPPPPEVLEEPVEPAEPDVPQVDEPMVRSVLSGLGNMACMIDGAAPDIWRFTDDELDQLTPPLTRLANRNDPLRRALLSGDYVVIALHLSGYTARNIKLRKDANGQPRQGQSLDRPNQPAAAQLHNGGGQPAAGAHGGRPAYGPAVP